MKLLIALFFFIPFSAYSCNEQEATVVNNLQSDPCDGPDAKIECMFNGMPSQLSSVMKIAADDEPGERLVIRGQLFHKDGTTPFANVVMYAYHTDINGKYSKKGNEKGVQKWHGYLHGWAKTDAEGRYEINTIRPAQYPSRDQPAHIHAAILEPGKPGYWISDFVFKGDPMLSAHTSSGMPGGDGVVDLSKSGDGWKGTRNVTLKN